MLNPISRRQKFLLALSLILAAGFYLVAVLWAGSAVVLQTISTLSLLDWLLLLACSMGNYALRFLRWHLYARALGCHIRRGLHFLYYLSGFALTTTPAKAGELLRSFYLKQHGLPYHQSIAMFVSERFLDVLVMACLASLTVLQFGDYGEFVLLATLLMVGLLLLIKSPLFTLLLDLGHDNVRLERLQRLLAHLRELLHSAQQLLRYRLLTLGLLLGSIAWLIQGMAFYSILQLLGLETSLLAAMGIYAISLLAGAATLIPGGVGGTEVVMGLLLAASGADTSVAVAAPLISRLTTLWFAVALGLLANLLIGRQALRGTQ